ncbi:hypothetical protein FK178_01975 [Antarcticibacterium arcticum]|uniref:DUF2231 domain-containing protein n=1 Tax=Antarcticibacterium arcticum TaxID=2585771 RepID=A0A5B8YJK1_9FLAO|nr:DUF2231 domain-containing protein [Antarcticibacterium arcticum]QED36556.1 hypothetical protein FK178_01975 [Antarcticibacterium arcticum]
MEIFPDFLRTEVLHPLFVHFPIALLLVATLFKIAGLWPKGKFLDLPASILLFLGTLGGWMAIYTGNLADGIVSRNLCDPTVLKTHENTAYTMIWLFTSALILDVVYQAGILNFKSSIARGLLIILLLIGSGYVGFVGHSGASLVYEQAAGVNIPSANCDEFN